MQDKEKRLQLTSGIVQFFRPTGYGKSLIYQSSLFLALCDHLTHENCIKNKSFVNGGVSLAQRSYRRPIK